MTNKLTVATIVLGSALLGGCVVDPGYGSGYGPGYGYGGGGYYSGGAYYVDRGGPPRGRGSWRDRGDDRYDRRYDHRR